MDAEHRPVRPGLLCETCTFEELFPSVWYSWDELVNHVRANHWRRAGVKQNQPVYLCSYCDHPQQTSVDPVVDSFGNFYCSMQCVGRSYEARLDSSRMTHLLAQERRDEEYVRRSLGIE